MKMNLRPIRIAGTGILFLAIVLGIGIYIKQQQESNLSSLNTGIHALESQINKLPSVTANSKATMTQKIATLEKQINSLPETLPTKKDLNRQLADLQQEINIFPDDSIPSKDRLSLEKERLSLEKDLATARNAILGTLLQAASAIFFVFTAYFTWRNVKAAEEKQITERFSKAVELLGSDKIEVRLGGIYALERIAKDSPKDHWTIMEVLTSFIREKSPLEQKPRNKPLIQEYINQTSQSNPQDHSLPKIATDVQAALTVIGRRNVQEDKEKINLSSTNLNQANLYKAHLEGANLYKAHLKEANLREANLREANLNEAHLEEANLNEAHLEKAILIEANLEKAHLVTAHLEGAHLKQAYVREAHLEASHMEGAFLINAHLEKAHLIPAFLTNFVISIAERLMQYKVDPD